MMAVEQDTSLPAADQATQAVIESLEAQLRPPSRV